MHVLGRTEISPLWRPVIACGPRIWKSSLEGPPEGLMSPLGLSTAALALLGPYLPCRAVRQHVAYSSAPRTF